MAMQLGGNVSVVRSRTKAGNGFNFTVTVVEPTCDGSPGCHVWSEMPTDNKQKAKARAKELAGKGWGTYLGVITL